MDKFSNTQLLDLLTRSFHFTDTRPIAPRHADIGVKRVVSVIINEVGSPEIGLADEPGTDEIEIYYLDRLQISPLDMPAQVRIQAQTPAAPCALGTH